jgi:hypothetical protein
MTAMHTHQSSAYRPREAAWQGCAPQEAGRGCLRALAFAAKKGASILDTQAISLSNAEALP